VNEQKLQVANVKAIRGWLRKHAETFLTGCDRLDKTPQCFLQHCILPRALFAPEDAFFCAKFAATMNEMAVPYWSSLNYYDKMHRCLPAVVYCITEREAANLGIFFQETLKQLDHWNNAETYARECASKPGFSISIKSESSIKATFEQYAKIFNKWHNKVGLDVPGPSGGGSGTFGSIFCSIFCRVFGQFFLRFSSSFLFPPFVLPLSREICYLFSSTLPGLLPPTPPPPPPPPQNNLFSLYACLARASPPANISFCATLSSYWPGS
jgi:hypothetical protein